jgi:acetyltransferase-like isoleucine patch superfamily enzyme
MGSSQGESECQASLIVQPRSEAPLYKYGTRSWERHSRSNVPKRLASAPNPPKVPSMSFLPLRPVPVSDSAASLYQAWLAELRESLADSDCDRNQLCRRYLTDIYYPQYSGADLSTLPPTVRVALAQMDPRNVTLEPEYYGEIDLERYAPRKPLLWLWEMFDRSPLGENVELGIHFRRVLAPYVFGSCGKNFKAFTHVRLSLGYNLHVGDNVVIHRHVLLDDRGGIEIGDGSSVSDFANVYSHSHNIVDGRIVYLPKTVIGSGVRITYHATILAGVHIADDSMVGAGSMLTRDTEPHWVYVGVPARKAKKKPADERAAKQPRTPDPMRDSD